jgi:hypothetical protein
LEATPGIEPGCKELPSGFKPDAKSFDFDTHRRTRSQGPARPARRAIAAAAAAQSRHAEAARRPPRPGNRTFQRVYTDDRSLEGTLTAGDGRARAADNSGEYNGFRQTAAAAALSAKRLQVRDRGRKLLLQAEQ